MKMLSYQSNAICLCSTTIKIDSTSVNFIDKQETDGTLSANEISGFENLLRRKAYSHSPIQKGEGFFNNSDMQSAYFLILVYDKTSNTPLLSARYYFDIELIHTLIVGSENSASAGILQLQDAIKEKKIEYSSIFLIDRMSVNISHPLYRKFRGQVISLFQLELLKHTRESHFFAMARTNKNNKLLNKYLRFGLAVVGSCLHQGKEHAVLFGTMEHCYSVLKESVARQLEISPSDLPV